MNFRFKAVAAAILATSLVGLFGYAAAPQEPAKKHPVRKAKTPPKPTVEEQIQSLREELQGQIDSLKTDLAKKDAQLKQAQQAAADAQAAASKAQAAARRSAAGGHRKRISGRHAARHGHRPEGQSGFAGEHDLR